MAMTTEPQTTEFWNNLYRNREIQISSPDLPVAKAALAHFGDMAGKRILDLGCGAGDYALLFASLGAEVVAVDISEVSILKLKDFCEDHGITNLTPVLAPADDIDSLGPFDLVFGQLILHHLEPFGAFVRQLHAALKPGGKAFFFENSAAIGAPALWFREHLAGKLWFPKYGDQEEFPLTPGEVKTLQAHFAVRVEYPELALFRLISHYVFRYKFVPKLFNWLDATLYHVAWVRRFSYYQYLFLTRP